MADNILKSFKDIIRLSGLDPSRFTDDWATNLLAIKTWLGTNDLEKVILEVFNPANGALIVRWDIDIVYGWTGDGGFWTDTEQLKYHILQGRHRSERRRLRHPPQDQTWPPRRCWLGTGQFPLHRWLRAPQSRLDDRSQRSRRQRGLLEEKLMLTVDEAFRKFRSRLELNDREQQNASARQKEVREYLDTKFGIVNSFLTGSYARYTKTKPLKDIDIFFVLKDSERAYRNKAPSIVIDDFHRALVEKYGEAAVRKQSRSVNVDFGVVVDVEDNTDYRILSVDVVPAFAAGADYEIPDTDSSKWIKTNPKIHAEKATAAHQAYSNEWKGLVRMVKYWNNNSRHGKDKPVKPSFLIEVMALQCLYGDGRADSTMRLSRCSQRSPTVSLIRGPIPLSSAPDQQRHG